MDDLISRQTAIDAFKPYADYESNRTHAEWVRLITLVLEDLPSIDAVPVIRCRDCKWRDTWVCNKSKSDNWFCPNGRRKEE